MTTLKQVIKAASALPPEDRRQLRQWLQERERRDAESKPLATWAPRSAETVEEQVAHFRKAQQWIKEHRAEYLREWVVLVGDQLISHGLDGRQVGAEAKAAGIETPFMVLVEDCGSSPPSKPLLFFSPTFFSSTSCQEKNVG
ncbi:MAG: hypothetical protein MOB07_22355, partial [Acidobacteria bacterium]|nr:hypothetical protein [Acidobacteriota bacterium]